VRELIRLRTRDSETAYKGVNAVNFGPGVRVKWVVRTSGELRVVIAADSEQIDVIKLERAIEVKVATDSPDEPEHQPV
jgi:hypothetical protein